MRLFFKYFIVALIGGMAYCLIEIIYRGRTHYSMFFAGAIVLSSFYYISKSTNIRFITKCFLGMIIITTIELIIGVWFNIILKENVWDYSNMPLNLLGQICLPFSIIWFGLSGVAFKIIEVLKI